MCGIVAYVGEREASPIVLSALRRLEYRGYDSAGIAGLVTQGGLPFEVRRCEGSIDRLEALISRQPILGTAAIGHTRWATHGRPSERNAHPHRYQEVVVVHNGIIENYRKIKESLKGHRFESETDSEVIAHLFQKELDRSGSFEESCFRVVKKLEGAFALAVMWTKAPGKLFVAKNHCPLLLGLGKGESFVASDIPALLEYTRDFVILEDGELAFVEKSGAKVYDFEGKLLTKKTRRIEWSLKAAEKDGYEHFMLKEIHEQPRVFQDSLRSRIAKDLESVVFDELSWKDKDWKSFKRVSLVGCGSAWHAGLVGRYWIEQIAKIPAEVDLGSEFRYRQPVLPEKTLSVAISQSGETADTLAALQEAKRRSASLLAITNTVESSLSRLAKNVLYTYAGPEISVASTKCFTAQLSVLLLVALKLASVHKTRSASWMKKALKAVHAFPRSIEELLKSELEIKAAAEHFKSGSEYFYLGRGLHYPIALEGALKLKEIAYINTQAYPAGEMKHGPIALISSAWPVVCVAPNSEVLPKFISNIEEVRARGGRILCFGTAGNRELESLSEVFIPIPEVREELSPILVNIALQLFAYHMSVLRGCNVDKPRNLAKSVTVE
ncbi:MAG: glutamine--fructose-6-phosphate transaminase (isomerizing) [Bradymonadales bacterium]|nr:MAG: glutamine--fructose-6-phosphate transaminase (isomerizing) [Bradymonadales bacterium]